MRALTALLCIAVSAFSFLFTTSADAQSWPQRTVKLVLPFGPGSSTDVMARLLSDRLQKKWGHPVIVENRPGGDGLIAVTSFVQSKDDHTLFFAPTSTFCMHPYQHEKLPYDPARDLNPIAKLSRTLSVLAAPATLPANDLKEFVALVRAKPGQMNYGMTPGFTEFVFEGFLREQGLTMSKVPYRDIIQAPTDLAQDRIQILGVTHAVASGQMQAGRIKLLAVSAAQRSDLVPDTPTVHELGFPKLESITMIGVWGPPSMPLELRKRISEDMVEPLRDPDIVRRLRAASHVLEPAGPEQFASDLQKLEAQIASIAQTLGVTRKK